MTIIVTMCKLMTALLLGYYLGRKEILNEEASMRLSTVLVNYILPFLFIGSVAGIEGDRGEALTLFLVGVLCYGLLPVLSWAFARLTRTPVALRGIYICMFTFSNNTFMGFPVVSALLGSGTIFYANIFNMPFNLLFFSLGMFLIRRDAKADDGGADMPRGVRQRLRAVRQILNNGVLASVAALVIYFARIPLSAPVAETCNFIGTVCMPLSMIVIGSGIARYPLRDLFTEKRIYLVTLARLALIPLLTYYLVRLFLDNELMVKVAVITLGMPIASAVAMGATPYKEQGRVASIGVVFSTLCSMLTIPVMGYLLGV